jgi:protein-L-isoaspartate(D-aspartate) O-methyltransferase
MKAFPGLLALLRYIGALFLLSLAPVDEFTPSTAPSPPNGLQAQDEFSQQRREMVKEQIADRGIKDSSTLHAMEAVPRHEFVPEDYREYAYHDGPLPIGYGQTISQPYIVALMTEMANLSRDQRGLSKGKKALEIGTGSGYQAAVLAQIIDSVYTVEIVKELGESAREHLARLGYQRVKTKIGDGYFGWEEHAPFDAIIVTAAAEHIPPPLIKQLKDGGRMVIPVGHPYFTQNLVLVEKKDGKVTSRDIIPVRFVPLTGGQPK